MNNTMTFYKALINHTNSNIGQTKNFVSLVGCLLFILLFIANPATFLQAQCPGQWSKSAVPRVGNTLSMAIDASGGQYGIGTYNAETYFEDVYLDNTDEFPNLYFYKRDNNGDLVWVKNIEGAFEDVRPSVLVMGNQLIVTATFSDNISIDGVDMSSPNSFDIFVLAYTLDGDLLWSKQFVNYEIGSGVAYSGGMTVVDDNHFLLTGRMQLSLTDTDNGFNLTADGAAPYLIKMHKDGTIVWAKAGSGNLGSRGWVVTTDFEGNIILGGLTRGALVFDDKTFFVDINNFLFSPFVAKFDPDGNALWIKGGWSPVFGSVYGIDTDSEGNIYAGGGFTGQTIFGMIEYATAGINDAALMKYSPTGQLIWLKKIGADQMAFNEFITDVIVENDDQVLITGHVVEGASFDANTQLNVGNDLALRTFLARYDAEGDLKELTGTGGTGIQEVYDFEQVGDEMYISGKYNGWAMLGNDTLYPVAGSPDSFSNATFQWKIDLSAGLKALETDFEVEELGGNNFGFTAQVEGVADHYTWNFGSGYPQKSGPNAEQSFFVDGPQTVCLTVSNCISRQIVCKEINSQVEGTPFVPIAFATQIDNDGNIIYPAETFEIHGVVHSPTFNDDAFDFYLADQSGGVNVFRSFLVEGYVPQMGDSLHLLGTIEQYLGLTRFSPQTIAVVSNDNELNAPKLTTQLSEEYESQLVQLNCLSLVNPDQWTNDTLGFSVSVSDGNNLFWLQIDETTDLIGADPPEDGFNVIGICGQETFNSPPLDGYFVIPRSSADFFYVETPDAAFTYELDDAGNLELTATYNPDIADYIWTIDGSDNLNGQETNYQFTESGDYEICLAVANCTGTANDICETIEVEVVSGLATLSENPNISVHPNPTNNFLHIQLDKQAQIQQINKVLIYNHTGKLLLEQRKSLNNTNEASIDLSNFQKGIYYLVLSDKEGNQWMEKVMVY